MGNQLQSQVQIVAEARSDNALFYERRKESLKKWEEENAMLLNDIADITAFLTGAESRLREMTLQAYAETGDKAPCPGVGIREITRLEYDPQVALLWATDHRLSLKLDTQAFEKIAKASPLEFVQIRQEAQATIATDLSKYKEEKK